jgi:hypothetical protein
MMGGGKPDKELLLSEMKKTSGSRKWFLCGVPSFDGAVPSFKF